MVEIRTATTNDALAISAIAAEVQTLHADAQPRIFKPATPSPFPPETISRLMATRDHIFWVGLVDGSVAGYAYAMVEDQPESPWKYPVSVLLLVQMGVKAEHRGRGVGSAIIAAVRSEAARRGVAEVRLTVWSFNSEAIRFYARHGFAAVQENMSLRFGG
jgi:ribosomal protein S18 acetylase RimI-like enzyme